MSSAEIMAREAKASTTLREIADQVAVCEKCTLHLSRKKSVPGEGPVTAKIMFIGEGPGFYENEQGRPFVGPSGHFLDELLSAAGLKRSEVFIGNVVKCRPPGNRDPLPDELGACRPYLESQIAAINPEVIVTLGRYSMAHFLPNSKISMIHGHSSRTGGGRLIVPMYHPAAALHQPALKQAIVTDFTNLPKLLAAAQKPSAQSPNVVSAGQTTVVARPAALLQPEQPSFDLNPSAPCGSGAPDLAGPADPRQGAPQAAARDGQNPPAAGPAPQEEGRPDAVKTEKPGLQDQSKDKPVQLPLF
jgi:uracil-DNA glycosylase family 4